MIYLLVPHDVHGMIRMFHSFSSVEQCALTSPADWCVVYGYELGIDEYTPMWIWQIGPGGRLNRLPLGS